MALFIAPFQKLTYFQIPIPDLVRMQAGGPFALTHLVLSRPDYRDFYKGQPYTILDNSIHELGASLHIQDILAAAKMIQPRWVIPPDFMFDYVSTRKALEEFTEYVDPDNILPVLQCRDEIEFKTFQKYLKSEGYYYIALPYKAPRLQYLKYLDSDIKYHFLGMQSIDELREIAAWMKVMNISWTIDTGKPFRAGQNEGCVTGPKLDMNKPCDPKYVLQYLELMDEAIWGQEYRR